MASPEPRYYSTRLIIALDPPSGVGSAEDWALRVISDVGGEVGGWKIGWPLVIRAGVDGVRRILGRAGGLRILDLKLADVSHVMISVVDSFVDLVDAVIAHSFVGGSGSLLELKDYLASHGARLILVYTMSHKGARYVMDTCIHAIDSVVREVAPWGLVAPATRPEYVRRARSLYPDTVILSPGVGVQGGEPGSAICAGADYEIVGRSVTLSENPRVALSSLSRRGAKRISSCRESTL